MNSSAISNQSVNYRVPLTPITNNISNAKSVPQIPVASQQSSVQTVSLAQKTVTSLSNNFTLNYKINSGTTLISSHHENYEKDYSIKSAIKADYEEKRQLSKKNIYDITKTFVSIGAALQLGGCLVYSDDGKKQTCIDYTKQASANIKTINYFSPLGHYSEHLVTAFEGINCRLVDEKNKIHPNFEKMKESILQLKRAIALDPASQTYQEALKSLLASFNTIMETLKKEPNSVVEECELMQTYLELSADNSIDPFKPEFIKNPNLFKKISKAPKEFLEKYPHLKDIDVFLKKYPRESILKIFEEDKNPDPKALDEILASAAKNPFIRFIHFYNTSNPDYSPILTSQEAEKLRDFFLARPENLFIQFNSRKNIETFKAAMVKSNNPIIKDINVGKDTINGKDYFDIFLDRAAIQKK
jgi:hypothetical protein